MSPSRLALSLALSLSFAACDDDPTPAPTKSWQMIYEDLDPALLSVWGSGSDDVFIAGADPKRGEGPWVLHWDGTTMTRLRTAHTGTLWWVSGTDATSPVYFAGEGGLALRYDRDAKTFTRLTGVSGGVTLFGIQPVPGGKVWAVGSMPSENRGIAYTLDGTTFTEVADVPTDAAAGNMFFKVWGRSESDLWIVGLGQKALHKTASGWDVFPTPFEGRLFTVHGNASTTIAVGGFVNAVVVSLDASGVADVTPEGAPQLNGVWVEPSGRVVAVGNTGAVWERTGGDTWRELAVPETLLDYHGVWVAPDGDVWAVGGFVLSEPLRDGMLLHYGATMPTDLPE